jgi:hypothetical protein
VGQSPRIVLSRFHLFRTWDSLSSERRFPIHSSDGDMRAASWRNFSSGEAFRSSVRSTSPTSSHRVLKARASSLEMGGGIQKNYLNPKSVCKPRRDVVCILKGWRFRQSGNVDLHNISPKRQT